MRPRFHRIFSDLIFMFSVIFVCLGSVYSAEIIQKKGSKVLIELDGLVAKKGDTLPVEGEKSEIIDQIRIIKVKGGKAIGIVTTDRAQVGDEIAVGSVKVGKHTDLKVLEVKDEFPDKKRRINPRVSLTSLVFKRLDVGLDYKVRYFYTVGPYVSSYFSESGTNEYSAYGVNVRASYAFNKQIFTDGWVAAGSIGYIFGNVTSTDSLLTQFSENNSGLNVKALIGYQWMWSRFNIALNAGVDYFALAEEFTDSSTNIVVTAPLSGLYPNVEFLVGWVF